jgi:hypothetical protein
VYGCIYHVNSMVLPTTSHACLLTILPSLRFTDSTISAPRLTVFCKTAPTLVAVTSIGRTRQEPLRGDRALRSVRIWHVKVWRRPTMRQRQMEAIIRKHQSPPYVVAIRTNAQSLSHIGIRRECVQVLEFAVNGFVAHLWQVTANYVSGTSICLSKTALPV